MPEVFNSNPRPRIKYTEEIKNEIRRLYNEEHKSCAEIYHLYNETISRTSINDFCHNRR